ncbi:protein shuttle craft isoform X1 [Lucilia sericata]|uniref:protein shuttle craft isoform X1 n=1 Tax=Lucilia sericata TaxID=13632 RepID=UPI0018A86F1D|nr:protein shuttle craft isoform X1 [Lucilia sericata]
MSADSKSQPSNQPPLSQLWPGFGSTSSELNNPMEQLHPQQSAPTSLSMGKPHAQQTNINNNYVNFNQFIMQHNLNSPHQTKSPLSSSLEDQFTKVEGNQNSNYEDVFSFIHNIGGLNNNNNNKGNNNNGNKNSNHQQQPQQLKHQQYNYFNPSLPQYPFANYNNNNSVFTDGLQNYNINPNTAPGIATSTAAVNPSTSTGNQNYYDNRNSYGNFNTNGTTYYANPFATGFDFNNTKLQANAPEFVPRFDKLSLNETNQDANKQQTHSQQAKETETSNGNLKEDFNKNEGNESKDKTKNLDSSFEKEEKRQQQRHERSRGNNRHQNKHDKENNKRNNNRLEKNMERFSRNLQEKHQNNDSASNSNSSTPSLTMNGRGEREQQQQQQQPGVSKATGAFSKNQRGSMNGNNNEKQRNQDGQDKSGGEKNNFNKRYQNGRRSQDYVEREERYERYVDRGERSERGHNQRNQQRNDYHQRYDNYRSNKRRDDWNRNRDRINGFRVEEKYSNDNGKDSPLASPEKRSPKKSYDKENEKLSQREKLIRDIETRRLECLVCVEPIKAHQSVWSCHNCYHILHLQCIIKWASSSKSDDGWRCPACQNVEKEVPRDYYCFCGKLKNPTNNRQDIAHSCGEVCGRVEGCAHACTLQCHPGPCPPCQAQVKRECGCGKTSKIMQCCLKETIECDSTCEKLLNCELHTCQEKCHEGKCPACKEKVDQKCHCAKQERQVTCTRESHDKHNYSCGKICGKNLTCGNHQCKDSCHPNECRPCKLSPDNVTSCPCGKMPIMAEQRKSCLDPIPVCEGVCGKTLKCGKATNPHHCTAKCHLGNCPPCNKQTAVKCRCGHMDQMIKCRQLSTRADDARCKKRCTKKRSCGKHKCNQECCIDIDHFCPLPCNYTLSCGKHKCDQPCHRGNCPPCYRSSFEELFCECGAEVIYPPVPCGTKRPVCKRPCSRKHPCDHPPQHNCHSAATCPPCMMFTTKWCFGHHEQRKTIPCSQQSFSCGLACNKPLPCGRHKCIKTCHEGPCQVPGEICKQSCTTARSTCGHKCMAPCHNGDCPENPCKEMVEVQCECGNRKQMRTCAELAREFSRIATAQLASSMAEMQRGNYMELSEILAPVKLSGKSTKTLDCNEECRLLERNRRLAIGLQIRNPDLPQKLLTKYSDFIRNFAKRDPALVKSIHEALTTLVKLAKESKQKSRSHSFPTMNREKRQLVHEMCEMFGVESVAYDAEPNRNVVATAFKDRSWLPATSIMEVMAREAGQRRVPVPSNNAWGLKR